MFQALLLTHALSILYMEGQTMKRSYLSKPFSLTDDDFHGLLGQYETEIHKAALAASFTSGSAIIMQSEGSHQTKMLPVILCTVRV